MSVFVRIIFSTLVGGIFYLSFGWFVFDLLIGNYTEANTTHVAGFKKSGEEMSMLMLGVSCFSYSLLISVVFQIWTNIRTFKSGIVAGTFIGALVAVMTDSYWYASSHYYNNISPLVADVLAAAVTVGLMGGVIALCLGWKNRK